jgi:putative tryptophan/tyrosine transport system substrate-binding protein
MTTVRYVLFPKLNLFRLSLLLMLSLILSLMLSACGEQEQVYDLGLVVNTSNQQLKIDGLKAGLKALGYIEGKNIRYHTVNIDDLAPAQEAAILAQLVASNYQAYWTLGNEGATKLKQAGIKKPIIVAGLTNPVQNGLIKSYYRPEINLNGVDSLDTELTLNRLNLLLTFDPSIRKIYLLYDSTSSASLSYLEALRPSAASLGVSLLEKPVTSKENSKEVLSQIKASETKAIMLIGGSVLHDKLDTDLLKSTLSSQKMVLVGADRYDLDFGALFSYGANYEALGHQSATYVDRVLHGVDLSELPLLQPTKLELLLNQKVANQIGWKFTAEETATADEVVS